MTINLRYMALLPVLWGVCCGGAFSSEAGFFNWLRGGSSRNDTALQADETALPEAIQQKLEVLGFDAGPFVSLDGKQYDAAMTRRMEARAWHMSARQRMTAENHREALQGFEKALELWPELIPAKLGKAEALLALRRLDDCIATCEAILALAPDEVEAHLILAEAYTRNGQVDRAIATYRKGLETHPESLALLEPLGDLYRQHWKIKEVIEVSERIHQRLRKEQRRNLYIMMVLAHFYEIDGQIDKAIDAHREAIQVYPTHTRLYTSLGNLFLKYNRPEEALAICKEGLVRNPMDQELLGLFERCAGSPERMKELYRAFADEYFQMSEVQLMWATRSLQRLGDVESAITGYQRVLEFDPNHRAALLGLGKIHYMRDEMDRAAEYYDRVAELFPDEMEAARGLALIYSRQQDYDRALEQYERILALAPDSLEGHLSQGLLLEKLERPGEALAVLENALTLFPDRDAQALIKRNLGEMLLAMGRVDAGVEALNDALEARSTDLLIYRNLVETYLKHERFEDRIAPLIAQGRAAQSDQALEFEVSLADLFKEHNRLGDAANALDRAIVLEPDLFVLHEQMIIHRIVEKQFEQAEAGLQAAEERFGRAERWRLAILWSDYYITQRRFADAEAKVRDRIEEIRQGAEVEQRLRFALYHAQAVALSNLGREREALALCEAILDAAAGPQQELALRLAGYLYCDLERWEEARDIFEQLIRLSAETIDHHYQLGAIYDQLEDRETAERHLRRALELDPRHVNALNHLGFMFAEQGRNLTEAQTLIQRALDLSPNAGHIIDSMGWVYYKKGEYQQAVEYLTRAAEHLPDDSEVLDHLGDALEKTGDVEAAIAAWEKARGLDEKRTDLDEKIRRARGRLSSSE